MFHPRFHILIYELFVPSVCQDVQERIKSLRRVSNLNSMTKLHRFCLTMFPTKPYCLRTLVHNERITMVFATSITWYLCLHGWKEMVNAIALCQRVTQYGFGFLMISAY